MTYFDLGHSPSCAKDFEAASLRGRFGRQINLVRFQELLMFSSFPRLGVRHPLSLALRFLLLGVLSFSSSSAGAVAQHSQEPAHTEAYLFAHMMKGDYGSLYYAVSLDGLHWIELNHGKVVFPEYHGHASIAKGPDNRYYLVGNQSDAAPEINFRVSEDLIHWKKFSEYTPDLSKIPESPHALQRIGAPKLYYDIPSAQYLLTWHTPSVPEDPKDPEAYWSSQRTIYVTSRDLIHFSDPPRRLFSWDMATIDVIVRPDGEGGYCAILKDERYPSYNWTTGKTIRLSFAPHLLGPYSEPCPPVSPNFREAPTLIPSPDGHDWYLYYEQYAGTSYGLSMAPRLRGPWYQAAGNTGVPEWNKYEMTPGARHGSMITITRKEYDQLVAFYGTGTSQ
jgi:hypothetical protein